MEGLASPFFAPQFEQKFVVFEAPQLEHTQLSGGAGFFAPQPEQKLAVSALTALQAGHFQPAGAAA